MSKLLIGTVVWCPKDQDTRADNIENHFSCLIDALHSNPDTSLLIINNEVSNERVLSIIKYTISLFSDRVSVIENYPQVGWAKGRNQCIVHFQQSDIYSNLALTDCDQTFIDSSWTNKILELNKIAPELHVYMIRPDKYQINKTVKLSSGIIVDLYEEWLGTTNVLDHYAVSKIGGYNTEVFPIPWGFSDPEIGRRYRYSGLLESTKGYFVDPIRIQGEHLDSTEYNNLMNPLKKDYIKQYNMAFIEQERKIKEGKVDFYFDPSK